MPHR
jgi:hypothetical protein